MTTTDDLNVSLARLMGRENWRGVDGNSYWRLPDGGSVVSDANLPDWRGSLDALFAPGGPVEYARNKGMSIDLLTNPAQTWTAGVSWDEPEPGDFVTVRSASPAEALATALHEAFMKEQGQ